MSTVPTLADDADEEETATTAEGTAPREMVRTNGLMEALATSFQFTNPFVGVFTLYDIALQNSGPSAIWGIFIVCAGQSLVSLVLMHLTSAYPVAGSVYQWARFLVGPRYGCFVGFMYVATLIAVLLPFGITAVEYGAAVFGVLSLSPGQTCIYSMLLVAAWTLLTVYGGARAVSIAGQAGMLLQIVATVVFIITLHSSPSEGSLPFSAFFEPPPSIEGWLAGLCAPAWAFWGFEAAAAMAEETENADEIIPKAISFSLFSCLVISLLLNGSLTLAIPDLEAAMAGGEESAVQMIFSAHCPGFILASFNVVACVLYAMAGLVGHSVVSRVLWSLAREGEVLPSCANQYLKVLDEQTHAPARCGCAVTGVLLLLLVGTLIPGLDLVTITANFSTCGIYTVYQMCAAGLLYATWTVESMHCGEFSLGKWTSCVCCGSLIYGLAMMVNLLWPREMTGLWTLPVTYAAVCASGCMLAMSIVAPAHTIDGPTTYSLVAVEPNDVHTGGVVLTTLGEDVRGVELTTFDASNDVKMCP